MLNLISTNFFNFDPTAANGQFSPESDAKPEEFSTLMDGFFSYPTNATVPFQNNLPIVEDHTNVSLTVCTGKMEVELGAKENLQSEPMKSAKEIISEPISTSKQVFQNLVSSSKQTLVPAEHQKTDKTDLPSLDSSRKQTPLPADTPKGDFPIETPPIIILPNKMEPISKTDGPVQTPPIFVLPTKADVPVETPPILINPTKADVPIETPPILILPTIETPPILPQQTPINMTAQRIEVAKLNNLTVRREKNVKPVEQLPATPVGTEDWRMSIAKNNRLRVREEVSVTTTSAQADDGVDSFTIAELRNNFEKNGITELKTDFSIDYGKMSESPEKKTLENFTTFSMSNDIFQNYTLTPQADSRNDLTIGKIFEFEEVKPINADGETNADVIFTNVWNSETEVKPESNQISSFVGREFSLKSDGKEKMTKQHFDSNSDAGLTVEKTSIQGAATASETGKSSSFSEGNGENKNAASSKSLSASTEILIEKPSDEKVSEHKFSKILREITDVVQKDETVKTDSVKTENSEPTFVSNSSEISEQISSHLVQVAARAEEKKEKQILKMRLHPAELGTVEIQLEKNSNGVLEAKFTTQTDRAGEALSENIEQLRNTLEKAGWNVGTIEVSTNTTSGQFSQNQQNPNQNGNKDTFYNSFSTKEFEDSKQNSNSKDVNDSHIVSLRA